MTPSSILLLPVEALDAESIVRDIDLPAHLNGPLFRTMFPTYDTMTLVERDETMQWYIEGLEKTLTDPKDELFLKAIHTDPGDTYEHGVLAGFCGWEVIDRAHDRAKDPGPEYGIAKKTALESHAGQRTKRQQKSLPETLDVDAWISLSNKLRTERQRVLGNLDNVCRLTFMSVRPDLQRLGIGSTMMQRICEETDACQGRYAYVLAAPQGVPLYLKFGFEVIGKVETIHGNITSMLRPARSH